jgi:hypothetical protein
MSDFNLRHLVRDVLASSELTDPHALADEILHRIDECDLRLALSQVLASMVREEIRERRNRHSLALPAPTVRTTPPLTSAPRLTLHTQAEVMTESPGPVPRPMAKPAAPRPARSAKVAAIRAAAPKWLEDRYCVGDGDDDWKFLGDCGFSDLMFAAGQRREQAARTSAVAERLEGLAELVRTHGVKRVRDLPASVLDSVGGAAA